MSIVDTKYFYWIEVAGTIKTIGFALIIFGSISLIMSIAVLVVLEDTDDEFYKKVKLIAKSIGVLIIISTSLVIFIPSQKTAEKMLIAKYVTYENVEAGKEEVKELVDYIFEKLNGEEG